MMKLSALALTTALFSGTSVYATSVHAAEDVVIVYDASGSMWGQIDGVSKIEIAREVMADLINKWDHDTHLGLVAYGHRRQGDCSDIETLIKPGPLDKASFIKTVNTIRPNGKTPISASLQHAADLLSYRDSQATIVLISDGLETCHADPCELSKQLAKQGVKLTTHVVGFDLETKAHANLACIAENTGGIFVPANNAAELHDALEQVQSAMDQQAVEPKLEPEPKPQPEPASPLLEISGPAQVTTGAAFDVSWSQTISPNDMVTIVPMGTDEGTRNNYQRTGKNTGASLIAPATPGLYELRYMLNEGKKTLATAPIEVVKAEMSISGPAQVTTGAAFDVSWSQTISPNDMVTIVPMGTDEGTRNNYQRTGKNTEASLIAPATPGLYELRYMLNEGKTTLATTPIEVVEPEMGIAGPAIVRAGTDVDISWSSTIGPTDIVTIVPAGADKGSRHTYLRTTNTTNGRLVAPIEPGLYEIRYVLGEGKKTLASAPLEVVGIDAPLDDGAGMVVPSNAKTGEIITITWTGTIDSADQRIAFARKEQADFSWITVQSVGEEKTMNLTMPEETGLYEVRFLDVAGRKLLGRAVIKVK
ncbi:MAG: VWA domain-containing protein [Oceanisphaera sp.]|uniref:VWA domain-containing protein n=1 Tax=Oceanisphaera sp. TaxID=1929979 RepID=UPI003C71E964